MLLCFLLAASGCGSSGGDGGLVLPSESDRPASTPAGGLLAAEDVYEECTVNGMGGVGEINPDLRAELDELLSAEGISEPEEPAPMSDSECQHLADCVADLGLSRDYRVQAAREPGGLKKMIDVLGPCYPARWLAFFNDYLNFLDAVFDAMHAASSEPGPETTGPEAVDVPQEGRGFGALSEAEQEAVASRLHQLNDEMLKALGDWRSQAFVVTRVSENLYQPTGSGTESELEFIKGLGSESEIEFIYCKARHDVLSGEPAVRVAVQELYDAASPYTDDFRAYVYASDYKITLDELQRTHTYIDEHTPPCADDFTLLED